MKTRAFIDFAVARIKRRLISPDDTAAPGTAPSHVRQ
jgi:hypothetical protein